MNQRDRCENAWPLKGRIILAIGFHTIDFPPDAFAAKSNYMCAKVMTGQNMTFSSGLHFLDMSLREICFLHILLRHKAIANVQLSFVNLLGDPLAAGDKLILREAKQNPV